MKKAVFGFLAAALLVATALPAMGAPAPPAAPTAAPMAVPVWLAGLTPAVDAAPGFVPQPIFLTACSLPDMAACTRDCHQQCSPCHYGGSTCTLENGCVCAECLCH